jgi:UDP-glucuronate decarboxylase
VLDAMAQKEANGNGATTRPPPTPSPLRFSKFFQVRLVLGI